LAEAVANRFGLFQTRSGNFALPAEKLIQVLERPHLNVAPGLPPYALGLVQFQGQMVLVLEPLENHAGHVTVPAFVALCGSSMGLVGFGCDAVRQIAPLAEGAYNALEEKRCRGAVGTFSHQTESYTVIDVDLLVECLPE
jgi:chemotaxis signal transduction protein